MRLIGSAFAALIAAAPGMAATLTVPGSYHFVDRLGTSSFNGEEELYLTFGSVGVTPNVGTTGTYSQGTTTGSLLDFTNDVRTEFAGSVPYDESLTGSWELTFTNGNETKVVNTPTVGDAMPPGFVTDLAQIGSGLTPTFTWKPPADAERIQIYIRDLSDTVAGGGSPNLIWIEEATGSSYTVPNNLLKDDGIYSIQIQGDTFRDDGSLLSRSRVFFDFTTGQLPDTGGAPIFLPQTDTTSGTPIFNFDNAVVKETLGFYDPFVAIGYDYEIGEDDPLFASVLLPDIGDGVFDLLLPNSSGGFDLAAQLSAGVEHFFAGGVEAFRILGIDKSAGLDPEDPTAFLTGLSFAEDGRFTGTMTPISEEIAPIPLPAGGVLLIGGLLLLPLGRMRKG